MVSPLRSTQPPLIEASPPPSSERTHDIILVRLFHRWPIGSFSLTKDWRFRNIQKYTPPLSQEKEVSPSVNKDLSALCQNIGNLALIYLLAYVVKPQIFSSRKPNTATQKPSPEQEIIHILSQAAKNPRTLDKANHFLRRELQKTTLYKTASIFRKALFWITFYVSCPLIRSLVPQFILNLNGRIRTYLQQSPLKLAKLAEDILKEHFSLYYSGIVRYTEQSPHLTLEVFLKNLWQTLNGIPKDQIWNTFFYRSIFPNLPRFKLFQNLENLSHDSSSFLARFLYSFFQFLTSLIEKPINFFIQKLCYQYGPVIFKKGEQIALEKTKSSRFAVHIFNFLQKKIEELTKQTEESLNHQEEVESSFAPHIGKQLAGFDSVAADFIRILKAQSEGSASSIQHSIHSSLQMEGKVKNLFLKLCGKDLEGILKESFIKVFYSFTDYFVKPENCFPLYERVLELANDTFLQMDKPDQGLEEAYATAQKAIWDSLEKLIKVNINKKVKTTLKGPSEGELNYLIEDTWNHFQKQLHQIKKDPNEAALCDIPSLIIDMQETIERKIPTIKSSIREHFEEPLAKAKALQEAITNYRELERENEVLDRVFSSLLTAHEFFTTHIFPCEIQEDFFLPDYFFEQLKVYFQTAVPQNKKDSLYAKLEEFQGIYDQLQFYQNLISQWKSKQKDIKAVTQPSSENQTKRTLYNQIRRLYTSEKDLPIIQQNIQDYKAKKEKALENYETLSRDLAADLLDCLKTAEITGKEKEKELTEAMEQKNKLKEELFQLSTINTPPDEILCLEVAYPLIPTAFLYPFINFLIALGASLGVSCFIDFEELIDEGIQQTLAEPLTKTLSNFIIKNMNTLFLTKSSFKESLLTVILHQLNQFNCES